MENIEEELEPSNGSVEDVQPKITKNGSSEIAGNVAALNEVTATSKTDERSPGPEPSTSKVMDAKARIVRKGPSKWAGVAAALREPVTVDHERRSPEDINAASEGLGVPKTSKKRGSVWGAIASVVKPSKQSEDTEAEDTLSQATQQTPAGHSEASKKFQKGMRKLLFINRMKREAAKRKTAEEAMHEDLVTEAKRRFLFDDTALKKGADIKELFTADEPPEEDFNEIVDQDDHRVQVFVSQELVGQIIESMYFKIFIFGLIVMNSILIGVQTNVELSIKHRVLFSIFDGLVFATFVFEILLKWYHGFWIFWKVGWNVLDFLIIAALLLGPQLSFLSSSRILRILRVLRAFRGLRSISALAGLSMVVQTILQSIPDMTNICLLLCIIMLMLSVMGVTLFGQAVPKRFVDLHTALFSLFICVTQDGWVEIFQEFTFSIDIPGMQAAGTAMHYGGAAFLAISIMIGAFIFANLVVAVVVTNLELAMKELKEENKATVDTLTLETAAVEPADPMSVTDNEVVPHVTYEEVRKGAHIHQQDPLQLTDLKMLSCERIEKYFLVLTALEENLAEYNNLKEDINVMYEVIRNANNVETEEEAATSSQGIDAYAPGMLGVRPSAKRLGSFVDLKEMKKGDILSNLMKLEEQSLLTSEANDLSEVIRSTRRMSSRRKSSFIPLPSRRKHTISGMV